MKVLFYDLRDSEKNFLNSHKYMDFSIKYCDESLNEKTQISDIDREETSILCVYRSSILNSKVLEMVSEHYFRPIIKMYYCKLKGIKNNCLLMLSLYKVLLKTKIH